MTVVSGQIKSNSSGFGSDKENEHDVLVGLVSMVCAVRRLKAAGNPNADITLAR